MICWTWGRGGKAKLINVTQYEVYQTYIYLLSRLYSPSSTGHLTPLQWLSTSTSTCNYSSTILIIEQALGSYGRLSRWPWWMASFPAFSSKQTASDLLGRKLSAFWWLCSANEPRVGYAILNHYSLFHAMCSVQQPLPKNNPNNLCINY